MLYFTGQDWLGMKASDMGGGLRMHRGFCTCNYVTHTLRTGIQFRSIYGTHSCGPFFKFPITEPLMSHRSTRYICVLIPVTTGDPSHNDSEFLNFFFCSSDVNEKPYAVSYSNLA